MSKATSRRNEALKAKLREENRRTFGVVSPSTDETTVEIAPEGNRDRTDDFWRKPKPSRAALSWIATVAIVVGSVGVAFVIGLVAAYVWATFGG